VQLLLGTCWYLSYYIHMMYLVLPSKAGQFLPYTPPTVHPCSYITETFDFFNPAFFHSMGWHGYTPVNTVSRSGHFRFLTWGFSDLVDKLFYKWSCIRYCILKIGRYIARQISEEYQNLKSIAFLQRLFKIKRCIHL